jgi:signal transduction histidine kinase
MKRKKLTFYHFIYAGYLLTLLILVFVAFTAYTSFNTLISKTRSTTQADHAIDTAEKVLSFLKDAETGQRGYIISDDSTYLEPYLYSIDSVRIYTDRLKNQITTEAHQQKKIDTLVYAVNQKIALLRYSIDLKNRHDTERLNQFFKSKEGKAAMDDIRLLIARFTAEETRIYKSRNEEQYEYVQKTEYALFSVILLSITILVILFFFLRTQIKTFQQYGRELKGLNSELQETNNELVTSNEELAALSEEQVTLNEELTANNEQLETLRHDLEMKVKERTVDLEKVNDNLRGEIEERKRVEEYLQETLEQLKTRNTEMDNYVYKVSHDLRAPLTSIMGLLNLTQLEDNMITIKQYIKLIENRINKSDEFIRSVLSHSRSLNSPLNLVKVEFRKIIQSCYEDLQYIAGSENLSVEIEVEEDVPFFSDVVRLEIIFRNIISNAIRYRKTNEQGAYLRFRIKTTLEKAEISIRDNGIGIPNEYQDRIFEMFFRGTERSEGSGLGLYIVKQTVEKLEGRIEVESMLGKGTTFRIELSNYYKNKSLVPA